MPFGVDFENEPWDEAFEPSRMTPAEQRRFESARNLGQYRTGRDRVADVWEQLQRSELGPRRASFCARSETDELRRLNDDELRQTGAAAMANNEAHHLLLSDWVIAAEATLARLRGPRGSAADSWMAPTADDDDWDDYQAELRQIKERRRAREQENCLRCGKAIVTSRCSCPEGPLYKRWGYGISKQNM